MFPLIALLCVVGTAEQAVASCGDYLYKPGQKKADMPAPMDDHGDSECNDHHRVPAPLAPTTLPQNQNDHFVQTVHDDEGSRAAQRFDSLVGSSMIGRGNRQRIDRPPQR